MADRPTVQPVTNFAACCWGGCKDPVQFLSFYGEAIVSWCRDHGLDQAEAEAGSPVVYAGPLGHISTEDPEPRV